MNLVLDYASERITRCAMCGRKSFVKIGAADKQVEVRNKCEKNLSCDACTESAEILVRSNWIQPIPSFTMLKIMIRDNQHNETFDLLNVSITFV